MLVVADVALRGLQEVAPWLCLCMLPLETARHVQMLRMLLHWLHGLLRVAGLLGGRLRGLLSTLLF